MPAIQHPDITHAERYGMPEPEILGQCACGCGEDVIPTDDALEMDELYFVDELHFARYAKDQMGLRRVG